MPAVEDITDGPWSANIGTAGSAASVAGPASVSPDCSADHAAVGAARPAAHHTALGVAAASACNTIAADDKGLTDVPAAAAGQVQADVQLDEGEHGGEEDGQDAELHKVDAGTG